MKKVTTFCMILLIALSSCTTEQGAVSGASLGGMFGSALGGIIGGRFGRDIGTMVGMVAGGATGATIGYQSERRYEQKLERSYQQSEAARQEARDQGETRSSIPIEVESQCPLTLRNLRFIGEDGNQAINRKESCKLIFELANLSGRTVYDVVPHVMEINGNDHLDISPTTRIESINNGDAIRYTAIVVADKKLKEGKVVFRISVSTDGGEFITLKEFTLDTDE